MYKLVDEALTAPEFDLDKVEEMSNVLPHRAVKALQDYDDNFKYCITCIITKKNPNYLHVNSTCLWNPKLDGFLIVQWEDSNILCIMNIFALTL